MIPTIALFSMKKENSNLPMSIHIAAKSTSLDNIKIIPVDVVQWQHIKHYNNRVGSKVRVWFPSDDKIVGQCSQVLNLDIDDAIENRGSNAIEVGTLCNVIHRNWLFAVIEMEYSFI